MARFVVTRSLEISLPGAGLNRSESAALPNVVTSVHTGSFAAGARPFFTSALIAAAILIGAATARASTVTTLGALSPNDSVNWSQLGNPGDNISNPFSATSAGGMAVVGAFGGVGGTVDKVCPSGAATTGPRRPDSVPATS